ncbi:hypothetical protein [Microbacterium dextranolyticum]|uniref:Uncharacterized protein n=1 Tax=Microbacterium dextranolyticum TaxID=36806 RepID=A0A9W6HKW9_9MICO|nr:hypothetical protein [Microbacterium dextranolyticum]MBM7463514.1 hypothetical protein [Microbacterium dextranolyticum]GLJ94616.1 hypothetical protein GCM10017591_06770 [Microbacterium dextranolyticum]
MNPAAGLNSAYVVSGAGVREVAPGAVGADLLQPDGRAIVLRYFPDAPSRKDIDTHVLALELQLQLGSATRKHAEVSTIGLMGSSRNALHVTHVVSRPELLFVGVAPIGALPSPWDGSTPALGDSSIRSIVLRLVRAMRDPLDWERVPDAVASALEESSVHVVDAALDAVVQALADAGSRPGAYEPGDHGAGFLHAIASRARLQRALFLLRQEGVRDTATAQLEAAIASTDAAVAAMASVTNIRLSEQIQQANRNQLAEDERAQARDRLLARIGAALLLPSIWFSYLGMNLLPTAVWGVPLQKWWVAIVVAVLGLVLALVGWRAAAWLTNRVGPKEEKS